VASAFLAGGCGDNSEEIQVPAVPAADVREELRRRRTDQQIVVEGNTAFALDLYAKLRHQPGNLFLSPASISLALGMTYAGARGETEREMASVLHFELSQERLHPEMEGLAKALTPARPGGPRLTIANRLWGLERYEFRNTFLTVTRNHYGAELARTVFPEPGRTEINTWTSNRTDGKIKELIGKGVLDRTTVLVLVSAIYFKGQWAEPFSEKRTRPADFHVTPGKVIKVPTMYTEDAFFRYGESEDVQVLELPYKSIGADGACSMVILLPKAIDGVAKLEASLTPERLRRLLATPEPRGKFPVYLPRFTFSSKFSLLETLRQMGLTNVSDLRGMTEGGSPFLSAIEHASFVAVDEKGTEAAAATGIVVAASMPGRSPVFRADHPFVFVIRHNATRTILFIGRLTRP
jgi:serpin B